MKFFKKFLLGVAILLIGLIYLPIRLIFEFFANDLHPDYWVHQKTAGQYILLKEGLLESDLTAVVIYQSCADGKVWVRPSIDFYDGRFVRLDL